jgi:TRAP-type mannitol/chloroaromatic compound transport system permease small subunit
LKLLLRFAKGIDRLNDLAGRAVFWLVFIAVMVSSLNALARYAFGIGSNAWLEAQWYMFALTFLFAAAWTHRNDGHVRVDVLYNRFSARTRAWVDVLGGVFFLLPTTLVLIWLSWPMVSMSIGTWEGSPDPGGLPRWPIKLAIPLAFALLSLQGIAEIIKRVAFLRGEGPPPAAYQKELQ